MSVDSLDKIFVVILPNQSEFYFVFASVSCSKYKFFNLIQIVRYFLILNATSQFNSDPIFLGRV